MQPFAATSVSARAARGGEVRGGEVEFRARRPRPSNTRTGGCSRAWSTQQRPRTRRRGPRYPPGAFRFGAPGESGNLATPPGRDL